MTTERDARPAAAGVGAGNTTSPLRDRFGIMVPSALPLLDEREVLLLRFLGRLEMMTLTQIHQAIYPSYSVRGVQHRLQYLLDDDLLWRVQTRSVAANHAAEYTRVRKQGAFAYGLSHQGKELLNTLEVEQEPLTFERLVSRDSKGRKPDLRTLSHDLQVSWWCLNVILAAAQNRACRKIYVQTEFYPEKSQRIDALIILRLSPEHPRPSQDVGPIPFFDGTERRDGEIDIRLALEVDKGTEELKVLLEKAEKYRELHRAGVYTATVGGPVLPIFLVQTPRRAAQIAREYQDVWPTGWGVTGTPFSANSRDSVLWGKYKSLTTSQPFDLLTNLVVDAHGRVQLFPAISREKWRNTVVTHELPLTAQQENGRAGGERANGGRHKPLNRRDRRREMLRSRLLFCCQCGSVSGFQRLSDGLPMAVRRPSSTIAVWGIGTGQSPLAIVVLTAVLRGAGALQELVVQEMVDVRAVRVATIWGGRPATSEEQRTASEEQR